MPKELPKTYDASAHEDAVYKKWEESGLFNPDVCIEKDIAKENAVPFSMVLPPPNVTGHLHIGHAVMLALQDVMARYHRMKGDKTLWLPGTDHAAIATQSKVEKILHERDGITKHDVGREEFLRRVEQFAQDSHDTIVNQCKKMGASLDWSREAYTLDDARNLAVRTAFKRMYDDGLIFRGHRIVNWDPQLQTTVSDDEVEYVEKQEPFYYFQYGPFTIGTARPETKFGDKYVVMHPDDERYAEYENGQQIEVKWITGTITATVIKDEAIDMAFGSGVMTITPWHDATDFDIAERHDLDKEQIIGYDGKMLPIAGEFAGLTIKEARKGVVKKLEEKGLLVKIEDNYTHNVATNSRGGGVIEPQIKEQWFVAVNKEFERGGKTVTLKQLMQQAVRSGAVSIVPERFEKTYFHWIDNLRDWCISRQIWYGHRIPVWYCVGEEACTLACKQPIVSIEDVTACPHCGSTNLKQDPDTLDTWFSSGLWTFSTLGWPHEDAKDLQTYHPTSVLETGHDLIFFWVARMILMSQYLVNEVPFKAVYMHGLVRDEVGRKMSKSLGNVIDPLDIIPKYGTDAIRLALMIGTTPGNDVKMGEEKIASYRNFTNKLWNVSRYVLQSSEQQIVNREKNLAIDETKLTTAQQWIVQKLNILVKEVTEDIEAFRFSQAGERLRDFTWNDYADWYIEVSKFEESEQTNAVLLFVLQTLLKLWHPFMPFVTEVIWQEMHGADAMLMVAPWPVAEKTKDANDFEAVKNVITAIRSLRADMGIKPSEKVTVVLYAHDAVELLHSQADIIQSLRTNVAELAISTAGEKVPHAAYAVVDGVEIFIPLEGLIDIKAEREKLAKRSQELKQLVAAIDRKLDNEQFVRNAPKDVVQKEIDKREGYRDELKKIKEQIKNL